MQESAHAAVSYARSRADQLQIDPEFQSSLDLHIHLPEGATQGRSFRGYHNGDRLDLGAGAALGARRHRHDRRDHAARGRVLAVGVSVRKRSPRIGTASAA